MRSNFIIRSFISGFLLLVFLFSITPKILLHDWFANHKDWHASSFSDNKAHIGTVFFNCHCENLVAESSFTAEENNYELAVPMGFFRQHNIIPETFHTSPYFFFELRGPPAI